MKPIIACASAEAGRSCSARPSSSSMCAKVSAPPPCSSAAPKNKLEELGAEKTNPQQRANTQRHAPPPVPLPKHLPPSVREELGRAAVPGVMLSGPPGAS
eukprot:71690-Prorocentrum_minimum.AAC.1